MTWIPKRERGVLLPAVVAAMTIGLAAAGTAAGDKVRSQVADRSVAYGVERADVLPAEITRLPAKASTLRAPGVEWCQTEIKWRAKAGAHGAFTRASCPTEGPCDVPATRDSWIPDGGTPIVTLRIKFNVFCNSDGTSCAATQAGVDAQMVQLNSDYVPSRIQWVATTEFINDTTYRQFADSEEFAMKTAYADSPATQLNVYVVNIQAGYLGVGTFPWDPVTTGTQGGLINDDSWFGAGQKTLTHETGHCVGLWHTHHGVTEVPQCSACWERADGVDGDVTGDFAADTDPTPVNYNCSPPGGTDPCSGVVWGPTDPQNYMSYAPDACYTEYSLQQDGRTHCWIDDQLTGWRASGLLVTPFADLEAEGPAGGPFTPDSIVYTLENQNDTGINYSVTNSQSWVSLSDTGGFLPGLATTDVTVSINSNADSLANGNYADTVNFINTTDGDGDTTRDVSLRVGVPTVQYSWDMTTDPGWTTEGLWAWGSPSGGGGQYGGPDPTGGYTGKTIYGYNLSGDYENNLPETHLTTGAIDCTGFLNTTLRFQRWLGVETPTYDHAYVRVSNNGSTWTTVWENTAETTDTAWSLQEFDIAALADDQSTVYLRWTMGTTDISWQYCGWNVDDVEVLAVAGGPECTIPDDCDDGLWCNGAEDCVSESCVAGTAPDCDDGVPCTDDSCNEGTDSCDNIANDANCDNGQWCDGAEWCDAVSDCQAGTAPDCDDGVGCTDDSCNEGTDSCDNIANDANCDNGLYCDGAETCHATLDCQSGTAPDCDDGVGCTDDSCNEGTNSCDNIANDANCPDDGLFCNGSESCDAVSDCVSSGDPCPGENCDEVGDVCVPLACDNDGICESGEDCNTCSNDCISGGASGFCGDGICQPVLAEDCRTCDLDCRGKLNGKASRQYCCGDDVDCTDSRCNTDPWVCDDAPAAPYCCGDLVCEGAEDGTNCAIDCACQTPADCDDGVACTDDDCVGGFCQNTPNDANCADDGLFCNGAEFCDAAADCSSAGDPCGSGENCNETADTCDPCTPKGGDCSTNGECCSGTCKPNGRCR